MSDQKVLIEKLKGVQQTLLKELGYTHKDPANNILVEEGKKLSDTSVILINYGLDVLRKQVSIFSCFFNDSS